MPLALAPPTLQIDFAARLMEARATQLAEALARTIADLDIGSVDQELRTLVDGQDLSALAGQGIRGEWVFATPTVLRANPFLLGYYRLLLGYSQKEFYSSGTGLLRFRRCETAGVLPRGADETVDELCLCLVRAATVFCRAVGYRQLTLPLLDSLTLLTLGPQLRGGANVRRGVDAIRQVMDVIEQIVRPHVVESTPTSFRVQNATKRLVDIQFSSDPDIVIMEQRKDGGSQLLVAIEVKGGTDFSNIHNRVGEAEKSHQKARKRGFTECWTVVNVDQIDLEIARRESPSSDQFFRLGELLTIGSSEHREFVTRLVHMISIPDPLEAPSISDKQSIGGSVGRSRRKRT